MQLPNGDQAVVEIAKLRDYYLNTLHPTGKNKARIFASVLGLTADHADYLREKLLAAASTKNVDTGNQDEYGQRYTLDFECSGSKGTAIIRSGWIIRTVENFPRLTTCYVL